MKTCRYCHGRIRWDDALNEGDCPCGHFDDPPVDREPKEEAQP